jgi:hypothetical protein
MFSSATKSRLRIGADLTRNRVSTFLFHMVTSKFCHISGGFGG